MVVPAALDGRTGCAETSGKDFSLTSSAALFGALALSSAELCDLEARLAFSCTLLNFSSNSTHLIALSSRVLRRLGRSNAAVGVGGGLDISY